MFPLVTYPMLTGALLNARLKAYVGPKQGPRHGSWHGSWHGSAFGRVSGPAREDECGARPRDAASPTGRHDDHEGNP